MPAGAGSLGDVARACPLTGGRAEGSLRWAGGFVFFERAAGLGVPVPRGVAEEADCGVAGCGVAAGGSGSTGPGWDGAVSDPALAMPVATPGSAPGGMAFRTPQARQANSVARRPPGRTIFQRFPHPRQAITTLGSGIDQAHLGLSGKSVRFCSVATTCEVTTASFFASSIHRQSSRSFNRATSISCRITEAGVFS